MNKPDDYDLYIEEGMKAEECRYYEEMQYLNDLNEMIDVKVKEWWKTKRVITENEDKLRVLEKEIRELENHQKVNKFNK